MSMAEHQSQAAAFHHRAGQGGKGTERTITPKQYFTVAAILAVVTALEVAVVYIEAMRPVLVPALLFLSFLKFLFVVMYFMHLRIHRAIFSVLLVTGLIMGLGTFIAIGAIIP